MNPLQPFLDKQGFVMLDGALATELERHGADLDDDLWSAKTLIEAPEMICEVSHSYLLAGADVIATASYQASFEGFEKAGVGHDQAGSLMQLSVDLALLARENFWSVTENRRFRLKPLVAASIGPYGACLADGSEYHGNYALGKQELIDFHRPRMAELVKSDADILAFETIPSRLEAQALIWIASEHRWEGEACEGLTASDWYDAGARIIGGCCRTGPADIGRMKAELSRHLIQ
jgi:homocysteine S-methyltransferase